MICGVNNERKGITIGVDRMPYRKKLCLVIEEGNTETKYATFNNEEAAKEFMMKFAYMVDLKWNDEAYGSNAEVQK